MRLQEGQRVTEKTKEREGGRKGGQERGQRKGGWRLAVTHFILHL